MFKSGEDFAAKQPHPVKSATIFSRLTFWWLRHLFKLGLKRPIEEEDLYETLNDQKSEQLTELFDKKWEEQLRKPNPSLTKVMWNLYGVQLFFWSTFYTVVDTSAKCMLPQLLGLLIQFFADKDSGIAKETAYLYALGIVLCSLVPILFFHPYIFYGFQIGLKLRVAGCALLYKKALKLTKSASVDGVAGQVINLMSNDVSKFDFSTGYINDTWKGCVELFIFGYFICREIGLYGLIGIGCLLSFIPVQVWMGKLAADFRMKTAERTDLRVKFMNEIIQGIQVIKMYTWERSFASVIDRIRRKEMKGVKGGLVIHGALCSFNMVSRFSIFVSLIVYVFFGNVFTAKNVFIVTAYFNFLYASVLYFGPLAMAYVGETYVSIIRIQNFLLTPEKKDAFKDTPDEVTEKDALLKNSVEKQNGVPKTEDKAMSRRIVNTQAKEPGLIFKDTTADWVVGEKCERGAGIRGINLTVEKGQLCAITGQVGCGKSTLLQVILGELEVDSGSLVVNGTLSYAAQESWLFEGSVRKNITFIEEFDERRYREVVKICALERDFEILPYGDATIVGEMGISLSGGQKARINLARAIYKKADIYLLDDPLSAVDANVGRHIFEKCIQQFLSDKVCVLVTHQLQYLKDCKQVIILDKGRIEAQGSFSDLNMSKSFALLITADDEKKDDIDDEKELVLRKDGRQEEVKEEQIVGDVSWDVYYQYFEAVQSWLFIFFVILLFLGAQAAISGVDFFVAKWVNWEDSVIDHQKHDLHNINNISDLLNKTEVALPDDLANLLPIYKAGLTNTTAFDGLPSNVTENLTMLNETLHKLLTNATSDMDVTPTEENEEVKQQRVVYMYTYSITMLVVFFIVLNRTYCFLTLCLRASVHLHDRLFRAITRATMFFFNTNASGRILNRFSKDIGAIDAIFPEALKDCVVFLVELTAISILVAIVNYWLLIPTFIMTLMFYGLRHIYINTARSVKRLESVTRSPVYAHTNATLQGLSTIRAFRAEEILTNEFHNYQDVSSSAWYLFLSTSRAFAFWLEVTCVLYTATVIFSFLILSDRILGGNIGLAITQCLNLIFICQWGMRQSAEFVNQMTSVERVIEYINVPEEPPLESENKYRPPVEWPQYGEIKVTNLSLRYSENAPLVLKDISFTVAPAEKIGIVGRTGAGKSSIMQALFRLAVNEGKIEIDGIDTSTLGLHDLRSKISIIPQDPIIFSGSLRYNLDPFDEKTDEDIWRALDQVELKTVCSKLPEALQFKVSDGGSNFSMGQRQLICLARAILRNNKILILDEATANVDPETDKLIQTTIRDKFSECTVLTIAHRLHTVMDSDRVLVMDAGCLVESGHAFELLQNSSGFLRRLVDQTGADTAAHLIEVAKQCYKKDK